MLYTSSAFPLSVFEAERSPEGQILERFDFYINKGWEVGEMGQASATVKVHTLSEKSGRREESWDRYHAITCLSNLQWTSSGTS